MKLEFSDREAEAVLRTLDAGLKNIHIGGLAVAEGMNLFVGKWNQAKQQEQNESKISPMQPPVAADSASQLG